MSFPHLLLASQAAQIIGLPSAEVARLGQIISPHLPARGKGHRALYNFRNLLEMRIVLILSTFGVPQKMIRQFLQNLRNSLLGWTDEHGSEGWIVLGTNGEWSASNSLNEAANKVSQDCDALVAIDLRPIRGAIRKNLEKTSFIGPEETG
jgi:hypothetical protein